MKIIKKFSAVITSLIITVCTPVSLIAGAADSALWPLDSQYQNITTYFNPERNYNDYSGAHNAIDISADYSADIYAVHDGICVSADWKGDYGYLIILWHEDLNLYTFYAHCSSMAVYDGQTVQQGDVIGYVGSTGVSSGNHLHFGICDSLLGGFPAVTYYDPLTYFSYDGGSGNNNNTNGDDTPECLCSYDYSGIYTTRNVETYLNIRSGHGSDYESVGKIPPNAEVRVIKSDGEWAHVEYNGVNGCCSMEFLEKISDITSDMTISDASVPLGKMEVGSKFTVSGLITSNLPVKHIWGGVYESDGLTASETAEVFPDGECFEYNLSEFDRQIRFNKLESGSYIYRIEAEDESGRKFTLVNSVFYVGEDKNKISGDINGDGVITVSDIVMLQSYLLGVIDFDTERYTDADINKDSVVDFYDMILMRKKIVENLSKIENKSSECD